MQAGNFSRPEPVLRKTVALSLAQFLTPQHLPLMQDVTVITRHVDLAEPRAIDCFRLDQKLCHGAVGL